MSFVQVELTLQGIEGAMRAIGALASTDLEDLVFDVGTFLAGSTQDRMTTGVAPDGNAWTPWSEDYAQTRHAGHSLLIGDGNLHRSIQNISSGLTASVGAHMIYGAVHQLGGKAGRGGETPIPARPYLGLSDHDRRAVEDLVAGRLAEAFE